MLILHQVEFYAFRMLASWSKHSAWQSTARNRVDARPTISRRKAYKRVSSDCEAVAIENTTKEKSLVVLVIFSLKMQSRLVGIFSLFYRSSNIYLPTESSITIQPFSITQSLTLSRSPFTVSVVPSVTRGR